MLNTSSNINKIDKFIKIYGKKGFELLVFYKLLKTIVLERIRKEHPMKRLRVDKNALNRLCIQKAQQLISGRKSKMTEEDVKKIVARL